MLLNCGVGEDSWESLGLQGDPASPSSRSVLGVHWKDWCWSWNSSTLATWWEELTHWKRPWCWEGLGAEGEGDDRGWDGWMASPTWWTWVWVNSGSWWWTGRPGVLWFMGLQGQTRLRDTTEQLNWTKLRGKKNPKKLNRKQKRYCNKFNKDFKKVPFYHSLVPSLVLCVFLVLTIIWHYVFLYLKNRKKFLLEK